MSASENSGADHQLVRAIGIPGLTANIVNSTIGAGIFALPAAVALQIGAASPVAYIICAVAMCLFVTCFAMAGSRVSLTGGLYAYVEVAFGGYFGFLAGALYFLTAILAISGIVGLIATSISGLIPALATTLGRAVDNFLRAAFSRADQRSRRWNRCARSRSGHSDQTRANPHLHHRRRFLHPSGDAHLAGLAAK